MLLIKERDDSQARVLTHEDSIFHTALSYFVENGEKHFHVMNPNGQDYDLEYMHFIDMIQESDRQQMLKITGSLQLFYEYNEYDENDDSKIFTGIFDQFDRIEIECADEYSVAVVKQILKKTSIPIFCTDKRLLWFVPESGRIRIVDNFSENKSKTTLRVIAGFDAGYDKRDFSTLGTIAVFHNMFFLQGLTKLPMNQVKYICLTIPSALGIGGILSHFMQFKSSFEFYGFDLYIKDGSTRYTNKFLSKYFNLSPVPVDSDETNTIYLDTLLTLEITYFISSHTAVFGEEILTEPFVKEMKEYRKAIIGDKKTLGILIRGTDYVASGLDGTRLHATVDQMIPTIDKWMEEDGYDLIFLATEDQHILERMTAKYGNKVRAIAQERHTVEDFVNVSLITELEEEKHAEKEEYAASIEDTAVNYFYALYLLSLSDSFLVSGQCNGWDTVNDFNNGRFKRCYKFQLGVEGNS
ncbi:MAG: hypothetical protein RR139_07275 [Lachnospiraceae bacterium]